jgi:hypothetical protein
MSGTSRQKKKPLRPSGFLIRAIAIELVDDFHDTTGTRIDQNRSVVHGRVTVLAKAVLLRDLVIGHARFRSAPTRCFRCDDSSRKL